MLNSLAPGPVGLSIPKTSKLFVKKSLIGEKECSVVKKVNILHFGILQGSSHPFLICRVINLQLDALNFKCQWLTIPWFEHANPAALENLLHSL